MAPRRNIELKARLRDVAAARSVAERIATADLGSMHQIDTYFHAAQGRLKLRETDGVTAELIAYHRADQAESRGSDYYLVPVADPRQLKQALSATLGVRVVVDKLRQVWLYENVRIHLDDVQDLGSYLEFEAVMGENPPSAPCAHGSIERDAAGHAKLADLCRQFSVRPADIVAGSYSDLLQSRS